MEKATQLNTKIGFLLPLTVLVTAIASVLANANMLLAGGPSMFIFFDKQ